MEVADIGDRVRELRLGPNLVAVGELTREETRTEADSLYHKNLLPVTYVTGDLAGAAESPVFDINPGVADPSDWSEIAFKGGSEPGVLNLSTLVTAADGTTHCVVATWNDEAPLEEQRLFSLYAGLLAALAE